MRLVSVTHHQKIRQDNDMKRYTKQNKKFYDSKAWKTCRDYYISKRVMVDGGMCEMCKDRPGVICDHIIELDEYNVDDPTISLNHDNLQLLCIECHNIKTHSDDERIVRFDSEGNPIITEVRRTLD